MNLRLRALLVSILAAASVLALGTNARGQNLYVAEYSGAYYPEGVIAEITPAGTLTADIAGGELGTGTPGGIAFNSAGELFVCAYTNILEISTNGAVSVFANGLTGTNPFSLAFNSSGTLFVGTYNENANTGYIIRFNSDGTRTTFASGLTCPYGLAFDGAGNLYEADFYSASIYKFTPAGAKSTFTSGVTETGPRLDEPAGLAFNSAGDLFVADFALGNVYEFTPSGTMSTFASGLNYPIGLAFNSAGDLFVGQYETESGNVTHILEIDPAGVTNSFGPSVTYAWGLAFPPLPPNIKATSIARQVQISVSMPSPYFTVIQASTNLSKWVNVYTNTSSFVFTDSTPTLPHRFYRTMVVQ